MENIKPAEIKGENFIEEVEEMIPSISVTEIINENKKNLEESFKIITSNIASAQQIKGAMTMEECKKYKESCNLFSKYIEQIDNSPLVEKNIFDSYMIIRACIEKYQATGVFSIDGSVILLEHLTTLEEWLKKNRTAKDKLQEAKKKKQIKKKT